MKAAARHAARALRNALFSPGARLFGPRLSLDYLRFAAECARRWGSAEPGTLRLLGARVDYPSRTHALFLVHEIFVGAAYAFRASGRAPRIVDCGANIGLSVVFFKTMHPGARIDAFEPDPDAFALLKRNVERNGLADGVALHPAAVTGEGGTATFYADPADAAGLTASTDPAWGGRAARQVPAVRLSEVIDGPVDFLKLDVEGAEYGVIDDLARTGALRHVREAVIEWHEIASEPAGRERLIATLRAAEMEIEAQSVDPSGRLGVVRARRRG